MNLLVASQKNLASKNLADELLAQVKFEEQTKNILYSKELDTYLYYIQQDIIDFDIKAFLEYKKTLEKDIRLLIVLCTHQSESKTSSILVHPCGNFEENDRGGEKNKLSIAPAEAVSSIFKIIKQEQERLKDYNIGLEQTHHGPTLNIPTMYLEIGSTDKEYSDRQAIKIIIESLIEFLKQKPETYEQVAFCIGGTHYAPKFLKYLEQNNSVAIGHILTKHHNITKQTIELGLNNTLPKPNIVLIDWKGLSGEKRQTAVKILEELKMPYKKL